MKKDQCQHIGRFIKTHGVNGELLLKSDIELPDAFFETELIFINIDDGLVPFFISENGIREKNFESFIIKLDDIQKESLAHELIGCDVYLSERLHNMDDELDYFSFIGFTITDLKYGEIGIIDEIIEYPGHSLFQVMKDKKEILIPITEDFITNIDVENKRIEIETPEGLFDL
jgi:16S rRNA processing protein RimM